MNFKQNTALIIFMAIIFFAINVTAQDDSSDTEEAGLTNMAQVEKAENLALATAAKAQEQIAAAQKNVTRAQETMDAVDPSDTKAMEAAQANYDDAVQALSDALADSAGVSVGEISDMRDSGMGWGQIAHDLGIHPSVLGGGHFKGKKGFEFAMATARDSKTGLSLGHGSKAGGKGLGPGKAANEKNKDKSKGGKGKGKNK